MDAFKAKLIALNGDEAGTVELCTKHFAAVDTNGDGNIDRAEIITFYLAHHAGSTQADAEAAGDWLIKQLDVNGDHQISLEEYITGMKKMQASHTA